MPTPTPELQNLLARARFFTLARQLNAWAAKMRKPRLPLLWDAIRGFFSCPRRDVPNDMRLGSLAPSRLSSVGITPLFAAIHPG